MSTVSDAVIILLGDFAGFLTLAVREVYLHFGGDRG